MIQLRDYQEKLKQKTRNAFRNYRKIIMLAPCGAGKTIISSSIIADSINKGKKVWFIVHRQELQSQAENTFKKIGIVSDNVKVYMIQTLVNLIKKNKINEIPDMIVLDECQHSSSKTYLTLFNTYKDTFFLGLSATPCRLSGKPLGDIYENIVSEIEAEDLIKMGFLAKYDYYAPKLKADFSQVKIKSTGDYDSEQVERELSNSTIYGDIIKYYNKLAKNKKTIIYCPTISYSLKIEKLFNENGYVARHFDGTTKDSERKQIIEDFTEGKIKILTNVDLIGEGFDVPSCETVILLRPTQSLSLYIQQSTRCLRPDGDKKSVIIDMVGNCYRHGMPTEKREWSLDKKMKCENPSGEEAILIRQCPNCYKVYEPKSKVCPYCKYEAQPTPREIKEQEKAELEKIQKIEKYQRKNEVYNCKTMSELVAYAKSKGYKNPGGWAYFILKSRKEKERKNGRRS